MTIGEKIRTLRNARGYSQKLLGELADGINEVTIRKYEAGDRNPKPEQLEKIARALGTSVAYFMESNIETGADVMALLMQLDRKVGLKFDYKVVAGKIDPASINISFDNNHINEQLVEYILAMEFLRRGTTAVKEDNEISEKEKITTLKDYEGDYEELKQKLLNDQEIVKTDKNLFELYARLSFKQRKMYDRRCKEKLILQRQL